MQYLVAVVTMRKFHHVRSQLNEYKEPTYDERVIRHVQFLETQSRDDAEQLAQAIKRVAPRQGSRDAYVVVQVSDVRGKPAYVEIQDFADAGFEIEHERRERGDDDDKSS